MELSMKKILGSICTVALLSSVSYADFLRVEIGGGAWEQKPSGKAIRTDGDGVLNLEGEYTSAEKTASDIYGWGLLKHPVPIIPNVRLEYASITDEGKVNGKVDGVSVPADAKTTLKTKQVDLIPYYNLLDNLFWITLDLGIDAKFFKSDASIDSVNVGSSSYIGYSNSVNAVIPLVYVRGRVQVPATGLGVEADIKAITYSDTTVYDVRAKVDYTFTSVPVVQPGIEIGYRIQKLKIDDGEKTQVDLDYQGVYAGVMLRF